MQEYGLLVVVSIVAIVIVAGVISFVAVASNIGVNQLKGSITAAATQNTCESGCFASCEKDSNCISICLKEKCGYK